MTIIGVFSAVDTLRTNLQNSVDKLGSNTIYIQKWPWEFGNDYQWWKYLNWPQVSLRDYEKIKTRVANAEVMSYSVYVGNRTIKYLNNTIDGASILAVSHEMQDTRSFEFEEGRYFSESESMHGSRGIILGSKIANGLFPNINPVGHSVNVFGLNIPVIGVLKEEGEDILGMSNDNLAFIPLNYARGVVNIQDEQFSPDITVKGKPGVSLYQLEDELKGAMRSVRKLNPTQEENFALNKPTVLTNQLDSMFGIINLAGGVIGIFSILVGGFGIANIMFVSVKERTHIIGIQKSLGAKNYFILLQFLIEAIMLCIMGGVIGLAIIYFIAYIVNKTADVSIVVDSGKVLLMLVLSTSIGLISGIVPALMASRLDPVEAIRSK